MQLLFDRLNLSFRFRKLSFYNIISTYSYKMCTIVLHEFIAISSNLVSLFFFLVSTMYVEHSKWEYGVHCQCHSIEFTFLHIFDSIDTLCVYCTFTSTVDVCIRHYNSLAVLLHRSATGSMYTDSHKVNNQNHFNRCRSKATERLAYNTHPPYLDNIFKFLQFSHS